jgi:tetratricopeptide (TPR) repeat protein
MLYRTVRRTRDWVICVVLPAAMAATSTQADDMNVEGDLADEAELASAQVLLDIERYQRAVQDLELNGGAWDENLSEELLGYGAVLQQQGEHEQAVHVFDRAAHLARVNFGLEALEQIPALQGRISSHLAMGEWEEADRQQQYAYYVHTRAMDRQDPDLPDALAEYARWSITSYYRGLGEFPHVRLVDAFRLYSAAHALAAEHHSDPELQMAYLNDLAGTAYLVARTNAVQIANAQPNARGFNEFAAVDASVLDAYRYRSSGFNQGEIALIKAIELQAGLNSEQYSIERHAEALAKLGDWYLLFDRRQAAMRLYGEAWQLLEAESPGQAQEFFATVQILPQFSNFHEQRRAAAAGRTGQAFERGFVDLSFNISPFGRLGNIEVMYIDPADEEPRIHRLLRDLRQSVVRPRFEDGEPVEVTGVTMRMPYRF